MQTKVLQALLMSSRIVHHCKRSPVYPTAANSQSPSHGQKTPNEQHFYKTTIPINEQQQPNHHYKINANSTLQNQQLNEAVGCYCNNGASSQLSLTNLKDLTQNVNAINTFNQNLHYLFSQSNLKQRAYFTTSCANNSSLQNYERDCLGLWGSEGDNDIPGCVSGLDRLQKKKYNKVNLPENFTADYK